jgi:hypothetical protein
MSTSSISTPNATPGRPPVLDDLGRARICALVSIGISLRSAARMVGCHPKTIRREARRNPDFGNELRKSQSQAQVGPIKTMREAAATNWRAAAWWLERLDPIISAQASSTALGKREGNKLVRDLLDIIDHVVSSPRERQRLEELLSAAMPNTMRRAWDHCQSRRRLNQAMKCLNKRPEPFGDVVWSNEGQEFEEQQQYLDRLMESIRSELDLPTSNGNGRPAAAARQSAPLSFVPSPAHYVPPPGQNSGNKAPPSGDIHRHSQHRPRPGEAKPPE